MCPAGSERPRGAASRVRNTAVANALCYFGRFRRNERHSLVFILCSSLCVFHDRQGLLVRSVLETWTIFKCLLPRAGVGLANDDFSLFLCSLFVVCCCIVALYSCCARVHGVVRSGFQWCAHRRERVGGQVVACRRQFSQCKLPLEFSTRLSSSVLILIFLIDALCVPVLLISSLLKNSKIYLFPRFVPLRLIPNAR